MLAELDFGTLPVLIVGAGTVATRKLVSMVTLPAHLKVVSPQFSPDFIASLASLVAGCDLAASEAISQHNWIEFSNEVQDIVFDLEGKKLEISVRKFQEADLHGFSVVFAASDDVLLNGEIARRQISKGLLVNDASSASSGNLRSVANARFAHLEVGVASLGTAPAVTRWICGKLAEQVSPALDRFVGLCAEVRDEARRNGIAARPGAWDSVLGSDALALLENGDEELAIGEIRQCLL